RAPCERADRADEGAAEAKGRGDRFRRSAGPAPPDACERNGGAESPEPGPVRDDSAACGRLPLSLAQDEPSKAESEQAPEGGPPEQVEEDWRRPESPSRIREEEDAAANEGDGAGYSDRVHEASIGSVGPVQESMRARASPF